MINQNLETPGIAAYIPDPHVRELFLSIWSYDPESALRYLDAAYSVHTIRNGMNRRGAHISNRHAAYQD